MFPTSMDICLTTGWGYTRALQPFGSELIHEPDSLVGVSYYLRALQPCGRELLRALQLYGHELFASPES